MPVMHIINKLYGDWEIAQFINRLPCKHENLGFIPRNEKKNKTKLGMLMLIAMGGQRNVDLAGLPGELNG